ncbi:hypothetical protein HME9302_00757 [Alteripontixanthobacter maritimus]|uniref:Peptidase S24/S26A/S26B/S26C domain-containing protein n=1 Tax=Alteripontixanthobacter maritimus TaxID=2161824 RepID=A0A369Q8I1_9SPHN|nr:LexA family transcriptional regulator [Alteripontixanthobacter maritimus]RDC59567.1 hypothetical protein HME9302_00757 [Alteripontixanthobacter maritimus]
MKDISSAERLVRERLVGAAKAQGVSMAQLSKFIGRNAAYLHQFVSRFSPRRLEERDRLKIAEFLGVPESELRAGEGYRKPRFADGAADSQVISQLKNGVRWIDVPRLPLGASAGPGALGAEEISFDSFRFSERWVREMGLEHAELTAIRVEGDSMEPVLRSGDEILVDRANRSGRDGIHVVRLDDALHVKRLAPARPGRIALISANEAYPPVEVGADELDIVGRVVWKGGRL